MKLIVRAPTYMYYEFILILIDEFPLSMPQKALHLKQAYTRQLSCCKHTHTHTQNHISPKIPKFVEDEILEGV